MAASWRSGPGCTKMPSPGAAAKQIRFTNPAFLRMRARGPREDDVRLAIHIGHPLTRHIGGILKCCHEKVPCGAIEAITGNIRAVLRRAQGYRGHKYLLLRDQKAPADSRRSRMAA